jgi:undecaprenyl diphosphate synthase
MALSNKEQTPDELQQEQLKKSGEIPAHIAMIMDGNGRWAKSRGLPRFAGHREGVESVRDIVEAASQLGVKFLTLYTFSTENWKRPLEEVSILMRLLLNNLKERVDELDENDIKLTCIGDIKSLPQEVQEQLATDIERTKNNKRMTLNLALSYSGRWELLEAFKSISRSIQQKELSVDEISEETISIHLTTKNMPDPDLIIRTSGEFRVSNFLLWQVAYSEFVISNVFWPEFRRGNLYDVIANFQKRERRFGKVSEQIK